MKIKYLYSAILVTGFLLIFRSEVGTAGVLPCATLLLSLENKVGIIKDRGGIWGMFDKSYKVRNHAAVTLKLDSKINVLIFRLEHLCATQNGVPFDEIAQVLVPQLKAKGEQVVMEDLINIGHVVEEAEEQIAAPGIYSVQWDGLDQAGRPAAAGLYYAKLDVGGILLYTPMIRFR